VARKLSKRVETLLYKQSLTTDDIVNAYFPYLKHDLKVIEKALGLLEPHLKTKLLKKRLLKIIWDEMTRRALHNFKQMLKARNVELYNVNNEQFEKALYKTELNEFEEYKLVQDTVMKLNEVTGKTLKKLKKKGPKTLMQALAKGQNTLFELTLKISENEIEELRAE